MTTRHRTTQGLWSLQLSVTATCLFALLGMNLLVADDWPAWRGVRGDGISRETNVPLQWSPTENIAWQTPIPGDGWSSPIVSGRRVFVTTATTDDQARRVLCIDRDHGGVLWNRVVHQGPGGKMHLENTSASSTPVTDGHVVVAAFVDDQGMTVACLDNDGNQLWNVNPGTYFSNHGFAASPILYQNGVVINGQQDGTAFVVMLDKKTGKEIWRYKPAIELRSFSTPIVITFDGQQQLILTGASQTVALDPASGQLIWYADGPSDKFVSTPSFGHGMIFSFGGSSEKRAMAVRLGGRGNVTQTHVAWRNERAMPYVPTPLLVDDYLHVVNDMGIYSCVEAKTGKMVSQSRSLGSVYSSPVMADNRIYFFEDTGACSVIENKPQFQLVARNELGEDTFCTPAIADHSLFVRTKTRLLRIGHPTQLSSTK